MSLSRSTPETSSAATSARKPQKVLPPVRPKPTLKQCAALIGLLEFLKAGCATVQLRPEPGECPEEAVKAMRKAHQLNPNRPFIWLQADANIDETEEHAVYENGPITGKPLSIPSLFPEGTLLDGHLWVSAPGDRVFGRFTRARRPDGTTIPLCLELCNEHGGNGGHQTWSVGYPKQGPGPREGTVEMRASVTACWTDHWR